MFFSLNGVLNSDTHPNKKSLSNRVLARSDVKILKLEIFTFSGKIRDMAATLKMQVIRRSGDRSLRRKKNLMRDQSYELAIDFIYLITIKSCPLNLKRCWLVIQNESPLH